VKKIVFLTNDDGVYAAGLSALESVLQINGNLYIVVAPLYEKSGSSHSITLEKPLRVKKINKNKYAVDGTPVDAVFLGLNKISENKPDIVISGINKGANLANDLAYSGTVAAAVEAWQTGVTAIAVSLFITDYENFSDDLFSKAATLFFLSILPEIEEKTGKTELYEKPHLFNVNIPDFILNGEAPEHQIRWTIPGQRNYGGEVITRMDPRGKKYYWIGGNQYQFSDIPGSDCNAVREGFISITPMKLSFYDKERTDYYNRKNNFQE